MMIVDSRRLRSIDTVLVYINPLRNIIRIPCNRGVAQLVARLVRDQEVGGSNPPAPILRIEIAPIEQATRLLEKDLEFIHG